MLDTLAFTLSFRKTDAEIIEYLTERNVPQELIIEAVVPLNFQRHGPSFLAAATPSMIKTISYYSGSVDSAGSRERLLPAGKTG